MINLYYKYPINRSMIIENHKMQLFIKDGKYKLGIVFDSVGQQKIYLVN